MDIDEAIRWLQEYCARWQKETDIGDTTRGVVNTFVREVTVLSTPDSSKVYWAWIESTDGVNSIGAYFRYHRPPISYGEKIATRPAGCIQWTVPLPLT